jgi:hypothetical protein
MAGAFRVFIRKGFTEWSSVETVGWRTQPVFRFMQLFIKQGLM